MSEDAQDPVKLEVRYVDVKKEGLVHCKPHRQVGRVEGKT